MNDLEPKQGTPLLASFLLLLGTLVIIETLLGNNLSLCWPLLLSLFAIGWASSLRGSVHHA